jgi:proteasome accessory factor A
VLQTPRGALYSVAQRAEHIWEGLSSATTRSRPIINSRDEPHADAERYRRLHVIVGDSNMSEYATWLKLATADLVLRMIEAGTVMRDLTLDNPIRAIREISHDMTCQRRVRLEGGRELSALEIQRAYLERVARFLQNSGSDPRTDHVLAEWARVLDTLETDPLKLSRECDWVAKYHLVEDYRRRHDLPLSHPRVAMLDLQYHDVNRNRGLYYLLQRRDKVDRIVEDTEVRRAMRTPPQTTRAKLRGEFIRQAKRKRRDFTVDWVHLKLNDQAQRTVLCKDPFRSEDDRVQKLIASM